MDDLDAAANALMRLYGIGGAVVHCAERADALLDRYDMEAAAFWLALMTRCEAHLHQAWRDELAASCA